jgi:hypothetical protein
VGFAVFLFILSSIPGEILNGVDVPIPIDQKFIPLSMQENPDKYIHFGLYFVFGWLWMRVFLFARQNSLATASLWTLALAAFYGGTDEWHQYFVSNRYCDLNDWIADCIGALAAVVFMMILIKLRPGYLRSPMRTPQRADGNFDPLQQ